MWSLHFRLVVATCILAVGFGEQRNASRSNAARTGVGAKSRGADSLETPQVYAGGPTLIGDIERRVADDFIRGVASHHLLFHPQHTPHHTPIQLDPEAPWAADLSTGDVVAITPQRNLPEDLNTNDIQVKLLRSKRQNMFTQQSTVHNIAVILVNFNDKALSCASSCQTTLSNLVWGSAGTSVQALYQACTFGKVQIASDADQNGQPDVFGPYTINTASTAGCVPDTWKAQADALANAAGLSTTLFQHRVYVIPASSPDCAWTGLGSMTCTTGCNVWIRDQTVDTIAHEIGHNLGFAHASVPGEAYGDESDIMGYGGVGIRCFNAPHMIQAGWLGSTSPTVTNIANGQALQGSVRGLLTQPSPAAQQVLRFTDPSAPASTAKFFVGYRTATSLDVNLLSSYIGTVQVHWQRSSTDETFLLATMQAGDIYSNATGGFKIRFFSVDATSGAAQIHVALSCLQYYTAALLPQSQYKPSVGGKTFPFVVSVKNQNLNCPTVSSSFQLTAGSPPAGWHYYLSTAALAIAPDASASAGFAVTAPAGATSTTSVGLTVSGQGTNVGVTAQAALYAGDCAKISNGPHGLACSNSGTCVDGKPGDNSFLCDCSTTGFWGDNCELSYCPTVALSISSSPYVSNLYTRSTSTVYNLAGCTDSATNTCLKLYRINSQWWIGTNPTQTSGYAYISSSATLPERITGNWNIYTSSWTAVPGIVSCYDSLQANRFCSKINFLNGNTLQQAFQYSGLGNGALYFSDVASGGALLYYSSGYINIGNSFNSMSWRCSVPSGAFHPMQMTSGTCQQYTSSGWASRPTYRLACGGSGPCELRNPCQNGGQCAYSTTTGDAQCTCFTQWFSGAYCETAVSPCATSDCSTPVKTVTPTPTTTRTRSRSTSLTGTLTPAAPKTKTPTLTSSASPTKTPTYTRSGTRSATSTGTITRTPVKQQPTRTPTATATGTFAKPQKTNSPTPTQTTTFNSAKATRSPTPTLSRSATSTPSATRTIVKARTRSPTPLPAGTTGSLAVEILTASTDDDAYRGVYVSTGTLYNNRWYYPQLGCVDASDNCLKIYYTKTSLWNIYTQRDVGSYYLTTTSQAQYAEQITSTWYGSAAVGLSIRKYKDPCTTVSFVYGTTARTFTEAGTYAGAPTFSEASTGQVLFFGGSYFYIGPTFTSVGWRCWANSGSHPTTAGSCEQYTATGWTAMSASFQCKVTTSRVKPTSFVQDVFLYNVDLRPQPLALSGLPKGNSKSFFVIVASCSFALLFVLVLALLLAHVRDSQGCESLLV